MGNETIKHIVNWIGVCCIIVCLSQCIASTEPKKIVLQIKGNCDIVHLNDEIIKVLGK